MPRTLVVRGHVVTTRPELFGHYVPSPSTVPPEVWPVIRPLAHRAVAAADYESLWGAHFALRQTCRFLTWAHGQGVPMEAEQVFTPARVERFVGTIARTHSRRYLGNVRSSLRAVARAATTRAGWPQDPRPYTDHVHLKPPYTQDELAGYWRAVDHQGTVKAKRVLRGMLVLGGGAGLSVAEALTITAAEHVRTHPEDRRLVVLVLPDRTVPVLSSSVPALLALCKETPEGPIIGATTAKKDPLGMLRKGVRTPQWLPPLTMSRLRTTYLATLLRQDLRISEFLHIAGTVSSKTLECIAPYVPQRSEDEFLFKAVGLDV